MSLFPIFKVNKMSDKNVTDTIYVFYGSLEIEDPNDLFDDDPTNKVFTNVFNKDELNYIKDKKVEVIFINQSIHIDDSIGVIKLKIFDAIDKKASMSELYLYCLKSEKLNPITVYQNLTQNDRLPLTKIRMNQLLLNLYDEDGILIKYDLPDKSQYTFDEILKLDLTEKTYLVGKPLGQKFVFSNEYPFIADPFLVDEYDNLLEKSRRETSTLSSNLLLETGPVFRNTIYLCLAKDVFEIAEINDISSEYTCKIYYPFLYQDQIENIEELEINRNKLIASTSEKFTPETERNFDNINMFYNIFQNHKSSGIFSQNILQTGIKFLKIAIYPEFKIKIPVDVIFKLIHATKDFPLIKYNPESRQENMYRLFAPELTVDGRKIPYLQKAIIFKLMRLIGKNRSVAVYTNIQYSGSNFFMTCEFEDNGVITVYPFADFDKPIFLESQQNMFEHIDEIIKLTVNPLIEQIKPFFEQSGLDIPLFKSIQSSSVEIRDMKFQTVYNITKQIDINKLGGCISSVFTIESSNFKKGIRMRYKRVSNFNKRESQEAFIIEKIDQGYKIDEIIEQLLLQFDDLNQESAEDLIAKIRTELEVTRGANKRRSLMIKINPGFQTLMNINLITSELTIDVSGINDIYYLNTIPIYIDSIIRITQDINSCGIDVSNINTLCSGEEVEDIEFGQIIAQSEQSLEENEVPIIQNETPIYTDEKGIEQGEYMDDLLDILGIEEDESSEIKGGQTSSSEEKSSKSVTSEILSNTSSSTKEHNIPSNASPERGVVSSEGFQGTPESLSAFASLGELSDLGSIKKEQTPSQSKSSSSEELTELSLDTEKSKEKIKEKTPSQSKSSSSEEEIIEKTKTPSVIIEELEESTLGTSETTLSSQNKIKEQAKKLENTVRDITGMKLQYPNPFSSRLEERMPSLFVKSKNEKIDLYTRMCPFSLSERRQPIILTKNERDKIVKEHPDEINEEADFIEYGTDAKDSSKKYYYTCPRYWCLLTDTMVTEQDILDGKCGPKVKDIKDAIIPRTSDTVPKGKYVYQFYDDNERKYPGFHKKKTPSGLCIPCCYNNWSTPEIKNRRDICQGKFDETKAEKVSKKEEKLEEQMRRDILEIEHYVKGPEKYGPQLGEHRWGFLPIAVQKFLHEVNEDCQISKTNMGLKLHHTCILRHGVEDSSTQSFIACIASAIFFAQKDNKKPLLQKFIPNTKTDVPTIKEMKQLIINAIDLDSFIKFQNGDLITSFADPDLEVNIEEYKNTKLYKKITTLQKNNKELMENNQKVNEFIIKVIQSFENFKKFLNDEKITIDYTYIWDLICIPNPKLFNAGINLIILEIPENDITNNIELVCPTNNYSVHTYDARKRSLILIKRENYFEPIYGYHNDAKTIHITKTFSEYDTQLPKTLRAVFSKIIKPTLGEKCRALPSMKEYRFKQSPVLDKLIEELDHKRYTISFQVLNFQGKVIGVMARNKKGLEGFIPCYPSALTNLKNKVCKKQIKNPILLEKENSLIQSDKYSISSGGAGNDCEYDFVYMNDNIWKPYEQTLNFLKEYYDYEEPDDISKSNCFNPKYFCRVVEDELITGFLTNTDQFVPIKDPIPISNVDDNIKTIKSNDMLVADINTLTNNSVDTKRVDFIKRIQLETNFYNVFRNTIRILFNDYLNSQKRKAIKDECNKKYSLYNNQLEIVINLLHDLVQDSIVFASESKMPYNYKLINETDLHTCISQTKDKCINEEKSKSSICRITKDKCQLVLPKVNLVNETDNEVFYYGRMADELIRYNRIKSFIFKPQAYLSFGKVKYNLRDDEIIILQDLLTQDFFENLIPSEINRYAKYNTYDTAEPIISNTYTKEFELDEIINPYYVRDCVKSTPNKIKSKYWRNCFPDNFKEIEYTGSNFCSLYLIIDIVKEIHNNDLSIEQIKNDLLEIYSKLTNGFKNKERINKISYVLKEEGQVDANQIQDGTMNFEQLILQDGFVSVNFDLWLLLVNYKIPSIFISSKPINETRFNTHEFVCYTEEGVKDYVFILVPAMYRRQAKLLPEYKLIINDKGVNDKGININISILEQSYCFKNIDNAIINYITIEHYLDVIFKKGITTKYKPRQKGIRKLVDFEILSVSSFNSHDKDVELTKEDIETKPIKKINGVKLLPTIILEEAEEALENIEEEKLEDIIFPHENIETIPIKKRSTRKQRQKKVIVNSVGK